MTNLYIESLCGATAFEESFFMAVAGKLEVGKTYNRKQLNELGFRGKWNSPDCGSYKVVEYGVAS